MRKKIPNGVFPFGITFVFILLLIAGFVDLHHVVGGENDILSAGAVGTEHQVICHIDEILFLHAQLPQGSGHSKGGEKIRPSLDARKPRCEECFLKDLCKEYKEKEQ